MKRWSGYDKQSEAWQRGYDWSYGVGEHAELGLMDYIEIWYDQDAPEALELEKGVDFAQAEQGYDY
jgi:hypothetical protein